MKKQTKMKSREQLILESFVENMVQIKNSTDIFLKRIVEDFYCCPENIFFKTGMEDNFYNIGIYNSKTRKVCVKHYELKEFLELITTTGKFELEMNKTIREMVLKTEKTNTDNVIKI